jgi:hypothetical protein
LISRKCNECYIKDSVARDETRYEMLDTMTMLGSQA